MKYKIPIITCCAHCPEYYHAGGGENGRWCQLVHKQIAEEIWYQTIPDWCILPDAPPNKAINPTPESGPLEQPSKVE